ncbi:unnamed protein product [Cladocopium goreaui]|uniref:2'-phosphotransferase n=1 Tax=Cladocopium goreaui TaxID=2562237 RepID=A0A9P1FNN5_9DINO|nr:unnamed protein product [Cladocopium goreaui]|mmetsp:Transcript_57092/g.116339  ORF Transcript_57092/g.116339 Transcript_57092/m.116339 type:complete len:155 (+) Transcript_57092:49-513(+)
MARQRKKGDANAEQQQPANGAGQKASSFCSWKCCGVTLGLILGLATLSALLLLSFTPDPSTELVESPRGAPDVTFANTAIPLVRDFVKSNYKDYRKGKVTLRHLKNHIVAHSDLGLSYEDLRDDRYSAIIEDEVDAIVGRCDGGKKPVACVDDT